MVPTASFAAGRGSMEHSTCDHLLAHMSIRTMRTDMSASVSPAILKPPPSPLLQPAPAPPMNPRTKRLLTIVLALDTLVVAAVVLYFMLRR